MEIPLLDLNSGTAGLGHETLYKQAAEKIIFSGLLEKGQMQSPRNPESGVATNKE